MVYSPCTVSVQHSAWIIVEWIPGGPELEVTEHRGRAGGGGCSRAVAVVPKSW
jgi:hypothetical protein